MAFGLQGTSPKIVLRNWLTFLLRELIIKQEKMAYHNGLGFGNMVILKHTFNARVLQEVCEAYELFVHDNNLERFTSLYNPDRVLLVNPRGEVQRENIVRIFQM